MFLYKLKIALGPFDIEVEAAGDNAIMDRWYGRVSAVLTVTLTSKSEHNEIIKKIWSLGVEDSGERNGTITLRSLKWEMKQRKSGRGFEHSCFLIDVRAIRKQVLIVKDYKKAEFSDGSAWIRGIKRRRFYLNDLVEVRDWA
ncbi:hypothetical protein BSKO_10941 [Bryopsis sp. KO-2023]|nr:hypothetical protein BSKO_10941 [Bryopsis sp. KO-2023]